MRNERLTTQKKVVVVLNGISFQKKIFYRKFLPAIASVAKVEVNETLTKNHAVTLASKAADKYVDLIIAAGGDGTLNQVINGVLSGREKETKLPAIGLIPIGSGNDFARTVNIKRNVDDLIGLIKDFTPKPVDIGQIHFKSFEGVDSSKYFVNVADLGMGPMVVKKVNESTRSFGHAFAYYKGILSTFLHYKPMTVTVKDQDWSWTGRLRTLAIGNGKCYGHGLYIAPDAVINDRVLDVFICGDVSVFDFIRYSESWKKGKYIRLPKVRYEKTVGLELSSDEPCMIEGDGEILGMLPASVSLLDRQLNFLI
jgi:diacylglycerol kinase (ATP)